MLWTVFPFIVLSIITIVVNAAPNPRATISHVSSLSQAANVDARAFIPLNPRPAPSVTPVSTQTPNNFPLEYALQDGWSVSVHTWSYIYPTTSSDRYLKHLFTSIQAIALAHMLQNLPAPCGVRMNLNEIHLRLAMGRRSTVPNLNWTMVYWFASYMLRWVENGFTGQGGFVFRHRSGISIQGHLIGGNRMAEATDVVTPNSCP